ncbi:hypothetical protein C1H46_024755 [Malus baccata]|uniref:Uncharacterized protein n=1 Tax=Malus baccata TaxID=106549 RepID=A0A540LSY0_MALBA|nr:hypothetical protein C1H46_024755 [Malus baccata]
MTSLILCRAMHFIMECAMGGQGSPKRHLAVRQGIAVVEVVAMSRWPTEWWLRQCWTRLRPRP